MHLFRLFFFALLLALTQQKALSQNWNLIYSKELDAEYLMFEGKYEKAADKYKETLKLAPQSANLTFKVGYAYIQTDDKKHLAIEYFEQAAGSVSANYDSRSIKETNAPPETYYFLGKAYQINGRFDEAITAFNKYKDFINSTHEHWEMVEQQILSCKIAPNQYKTPVPFRISNIGPPFNDEKSNFNAVFSADGQTMAYTSNSNLGYDIYISKKKDNEWDKPKKITSQLNENFFATASLSTDGTELYIVDIFSENQSVYVSYLTNRTWSKAKKLPKPISSKYSETHASITADGKTLYFTSNRPGGYGGLDIYKATRDSKGKWVNPVNLGPTVNTKLDEEFPFETIDGKYLFFSSQGHSSIGGFDVFYVDASTLDSPVNVGYPINNSDDNFFFPVDRFTGYMALHNEKSLGQRDIFRFKLLPWVNLVADLDFDGTPQEKPNEIEIQLLDIEESTLVFNDKCNLTRPEISQKIKPGKYQLRITGDGIENFFEEFVIPEEYEKTSFTVSALLKPLPAEIPALADVSETIEEVPLAQEIAEEIITDEAVTDEVIAEEAITEVATADNMIPETLVIEEKATPSPQAEARTTAPDFETRSTSPNILVSSSTTNFYTVQIMALRKPVSTDFFTNLSNVLVEKGSDDFFRYTVGLFTTVNEAKDYQKELFNLGYKESFIRAAAKPTGFTIQIMALQVPKETSFFSNLPEVVVTNHSDGFHRYTVGVYSSVEEAQNELVRIKELGYSDAFIRRIIAQ